jgi:hypothetical protein
MGYWRKLHVEDVYDFRRPTNIIRGIKKQRMRWSGHVARMGSRNVHTEFWCGSLTEGDHLEHVGLGGG